MDLISVEYPGYINNIPLAVETLGGLRAIERALNSLNQTLSLNFTPHNSLAHAITGDIIPTNNILVKIKRRKKKSSQEWKISSSIIGVITKTVRFRTLCDYQYTIPLEDPLSQLYNAMKAYNPVDMDKFDFSLDVGLQAPLRNVPPPQFTRIDFPKVYRYTQMTSENGERTNRGGRVKRVKYDLVKDFNSVPTGPTEAIIQQLQENTEELARNLIRIETLKQLFLQRPIWARMALMNNTNVEDHNYFRTTLPMVAFATRIGPFRDCWIKYGVNPSLDASLRTYQLVAIASSTSQYNYKRAHRPSTVAASMTQLKRPLIQSHEFDGKTYSNIKQFQICDIHDRDIQVLIQNPENWRQEYDLKEGWYSKACVDQIRKLIKIKNSRMLGQVIASDDSELDEEESQIYSSIVGNVQPGKTKSIKRKPVTETYEALYKREIEKGMKNRVHERVDALMKNLPEFEKFGGVAMLDDDNGDDFFDVFDADANDEDE